MRPLQEKYNRLKELIREYSSALIAFSGGVDSALLLAVAAGELGDRLMAVTAKSATSTEEEVQEAVEFARQISVFHLVIESREMQVEEFVENNSQRCYFCKLSRFSDLRSIALQNNLAWVLDGSNRDDLADYRPGTKAAKELGVRSPLQEAGFTKEEIRELSRQLGLSTWDKPSSPCLASRIPHGQLITDKKLRRIELAESFLKAKGFSPVRVRHFEEEARIEVLPNQFIRLCEQTQDVKDEFIDLGFSQITLDLSGFNSGKMNQLLCKISMKSSRLLT